MNSVIQWIPLVNFLLILVTGIVTVLRVRDALNRFEIVLDRLTETINLHGDRLTRIETTCQQRCEQEKRHERY